MSGQHRRSGPSIVHLTSGHSPFDPRIFAKECVTLAGAGYDVSLLAPHQANVRREGVRIRGLGLARGRLSRFVLRQPAILRAAIAERADLYHIHDPELIPAGLVLKAMGRRVVRDVHEDLPRDIQEVREWIPKPLRRAVAQLASFVEAASAPLFDAIVAVTPPIAERFPDDLTILVRNYPRLEPFERACLPYQERPPNVVYAGLITVERGVLTLEAAMENLDERLETTLLMAGRIEPGNLRERLRHYPSSDRVSYLGMIDTDEIPYLLGRRSRIGVALYARRRSFIEAIPTKLFEYMAAGLPVVVSDIEGWADIVREEECGLLVDPANPVQVAAAIEYLLTHLGDAAEMGRRGQKAARAKYRWENEGRKLVELYGDLLGRDAVKLPHRIRSRR